jgi:hypothetical protein
MELSTNLTDKALFFQAGLYFSPPLAGQTES